MIINDLDDYYIVFDTKNRNTELDTLFDYTKFLVINLLLFSKKMTFVDIWRFWWNILMLNCIVQLLFYPNKWIVTKGLTDTSPCKPQSHHEYVNDW